MSLLIIVIISAVWLVAAYFTYGTWLAKLFKLDPDMKTPSVEMRDDVDFVPIDSKFLLGQHFSAIAAAGPIVGPILAGVLFGWLPALLWILIGSVFIGGVHDMAALVASVRHKARSIAEIAKEHMPKRDYMLFLLFIWIALIYIIVAFTDIVASSFVGKLTLENGVTVTGGGIASSSMLYLALPIIMGLLMRYAKMSIGLATAIFLPLVGVAIWIGQYIPFDLASLLGITDPSAQKMWDVLLLAYCFAASIAPMWILLQPRGHLGGFFLYIVLIGGMLGILIGGKPVLYPAFTGWVTPKGEGLFPMLFIIIACGACSGFHALVASGTTSKQLKNETDAKLIGYGSMLLESMVAVISLCCVMMLAKESSVLQGPPKPNLIYGMGIGNFLEVIGIPAAFGISFGLLAFTTFVYDTLDVATRLGRYVMQELTGRHDKLGRYFATGLTAGLPLLFVMQTSYDPAGKPIPAWRVFWSLFGASNQLLAALTLVVITVWLHRTRKAKWIWPIVGIPTVWMYVMSLWALFAFIKKGFFAAATGFKIPFDMVSWVAVILTALAIILGIDAIRIFLNVQKAEEKV